MSPKKFPSNRTGEIAKNPRVDVWLDGDDGDDANDGFTPATAKKSMSGVREVIDRLKFPNGCRWLVINVRPGSDRGKGGNG